MRTTLYWVITQRVVVFVTKLLLLAASACLLGLRARILQEERMSVVSVVCCQVEVSAKDWSLVVVICYEITTRCVRFLAGIAGSNPAGGKNVCRECCVLSGRGLCEGLITRSGNLLRNYHYSLRNNTEERSSQLLCGGSLKSRGIYIFLSSNVILTPKGQFLGLYHYRIQGKTDKSESAQIFLRPPKV